MKLIIIFILSFLCSFSSYSQDYFNQSCGTNESEAWCVSPYYPTYFPMSNNTLKTLVVFVNYADGNYDPINQNSNLIYLQHWPGTTFNQKPSWADSVICPTTSNVWNPSLTGLYKVNSNSNFWLIGDVYNSLILLDSSKNYYTRNGKNIGYAV